MRKAALVLFASSVLTGLAGAAYAGHTHTLGHIDHGMGNSNDGNVYDDILHPYVDVVDNHNITFMRVQLVQSVPGPNNDIIRGDWTCSSCKHRHAPEGTYPNGNVNVSQWGVWECKYYTNVDANGADANHALTFHRHNHHTYCGS